MTHPHADRQLTQAEAKALRDRAQMQAQIRQREGGTHRAVHTMPARHAGWCIQCDQDIHEGDTITRHGTLWVHAHCTRVSD